MQDGHEKKLRKIEEREWYERYYWFFTSNGMLAIGGRSAQQNEEINAKYFQQKDLFFHANIFGASVVILKNGEEADSSVKEEVAQFAGCFSKAWENGQASIDVFAAKREQVSKSSSEGYIGKGSFLIKGDREWFKNVELKLYAVLGNPKAEISNKALNSNAVLSLIPSSILVNASGLQIIPALTYQKLGSVGKAVLIKPGRAKKSDAAKEIAKRLGFEDIDYIMQHLPPGGFSIG